MTKLIFSCALIVLASQALAKNINIEIITYEDGCPHAVQPDNACAPGSEDVCVMAGSPHSISWRYRGSAHSTPDFRIEMKNPNDHGIFSYGCRQSSRSISCQISESAPRGSYEYSVVNAVCTHDPRIIIN